MAELKPCPFCGGTPEFENTDERARLRCTGCGCEGGLFFYSQEECESGIGDTTEARAIAAWNTRTDGVGAWEEPMDTELLALRLHNAQLAAALRAIVDRDLGHLDGFVSAGLIPMRSIWQAREVLRVTAAGVAPTRGGEQ